MSQTWVIKDTAPVDAASRELSAQQCSFTSNGSKFSSISIIDVDGGIVYVLCYDNFEVAGAEVGLGSYKFDWSGNEAYKTLEFDTAPTGELLAWLQKNADEQSDPEYLTLKSELTSVANAIRAKGKTSAQLVYPDGFVSAIQAIQTGAPLQIVVTTSAGATVTATKGSKTVSGTADASGNCTLTVDETGTWTVTVTAGSTIKTTDVVVGTANVDMIMIDPVFGNNSWAAIIKACQEKQVPNTWKVGDRCNMTINNKTYAIDIIGKNHDDYADGSGKAPLTFQMHDCYADKKAMDSSNTNSGGWTSCVMRSKYLPAILALMPTEVKNGIREVNKQTSAGGTSYTVRTTSDKLFLASEIEIFGTNTYAARGEGTQYDYYKAGNSKIKNRAGVAAWWWLRSPVVTSERDFVFAGSSGSVDYSTANVAGAVAFCFCF